jgi:glycosyltransferase involved in cell wall biosynthesis
MRSEPGISVLIVTYNRAHLIKETLESVFNQTLSPSEIIIVDDGSTDNTEELIKNINDPRIMYFKIPRSGKLTFLRDLAVQKSSGEYIAFIDSDDLWHPDKLLKCLSASREKGSNVCLSDCLEFKGNTYSDKSRGSKLIGKPNIDIRNEVLVNNIPLTYGTNIFFKRDIYTTAKFDQGLYTGDHDFIINAMFESGYTYVPEVLNYIRKHDGNMSSARHHYILPIMEFNYTLKKLWARKLIDKKVFKKILANNYYLLAERFMKSNYKRSFSYLIAATLQNFRPGKLAVNLFRLTKNILTQ